MLDGRTVIYQNEQLIVRKITRDDAPLLRDFFESMSKASRSFFDPHEYDEATVADYVRRSTEGLDASFLLLRQTEAVAYFFLWEVDTDVPVLGIGIADGYQNTGLGGRLVRLLIDEAKSLGKDGIDLTTCNVPQ